MGSESKTPDTAAHFNFKNQLWAYFKKEEGNTLQCNERLVRMFSKNQKKKNY